jgi:hypothetical protein
VLYVPRAKTLYIVDDNFSDSPAGLGVLRHVFESCERLANYMDLELQGFQKDLRNIPVGYVPYTELNKAVANGEITQEQATLAISNFEAIVKLARKQSATGLMLDSKPYTSQSDTALNVSPQKQWELTLLSGESPGLPEIAAAIERVQLEIARVLGTDGMMLTGSGSNAMAKEKQAALYLNINSTLQVIKHSLNKDIMDPFWKLNGFPEEMKPKFAVEDVNGKDAESIAAVLRDLATAGAPMAPDDEAINTIRDIIGLPQVDLEAAALQAIEDRQMEIDAQAASMEALQAEGNQKLGSN